MTRICSTCKKVMGYKCHKCGGELERVHLQAPRYEEWGTCNTCSGCFDLTEGGPTHGICKKCEGKVKA